jgi:hypothetical protein
MVHYEGGVKVELRYIFGGVGGKVQKKPRGFRKKNLSAV